MHPLSRVRFHDRAAQYARPAYRPRAGRGELALPEREQVSQEWTIIAAQQADGDPDTYGNVTYWISLDAEDMDVEGPLRAMLKINPQKSSPPKPNDKLFGYVESLTSKRGNEYYRFKKDQRPEGSQTWDYTKTQGGTAGPAQSPQNASQRPSGASWDDRGARIEWQSARRDAISCLAAGLNVDDVHKLARVFFRGTDVAAASPPAAANAAPTSGSRAGGGGDHDSTSEGGQPRESSPPPSDPEDDIPFHHAEPRGFFDERERSNRGPRRSSPIL